MITLAEKFLNMTMVHNGENGHKGFDILDGATHTIKVYTISDTRAIYKQGISSYSQSVVPTSVTLGREPDIIKIEGKLCRVDEVYDTNGNIKSNGFLSYLSSHRNLNTIYNVFLPCSIVTASSTVAPEANGNWMVDMFKVKRNLQKRDLILFELVLIKWYGALPTNGA